MRYSFKGNATVARGTIYEVASRVIASRVHIGSRDTRLPMTGYEAPDARRRVAIVEDHGALRIFLRDMLTKLGWNVTGVAGTAETGAELVLETDPDVAVVDLHLASEGGGDALIRRLAESDSRHQARRLHGHDRPDRAARRPQGGRRRHRAQGGRAARAARGLDAVTRGEQYLSPSLG